VHGVPGVSVNENEKNFDRRQKSFSRFLLQKVFFSIHVDKKPALGKGQILEAFLNTVLT
jgi:hypothetical protein